MESAIAMLAANVLSVLAPYVAKGAEEFARVAGEATAEKAKDLLGRLTRRFAGDPEAADNLSRFEMNPDRYAGVIDDILRAKLAQDPELVDELEAALRTMGPELLVVQETDEAKRMLGLRAQRLEPGGRYEVRQKAHHVDDMTGAVIGEE